ncbi:hypothetical protein IP70_04060 [alpha proteobacterium AAP38]|nr:hypothetical protein IP70_04060 [alpha proteobacterium AAP38]
MEPVLSGAAPPGAKDGGGLRQSPMGEERSRPVLEKSSGEGADDARYQYKNYHSFFGKSIADRSE